MRVVYKRFCKSPVKARYLRLYPAGCIPSRCCLAVEVFRSDAGICVTFPPFPWTSRVLMKTAMHETIMGGWWWWGGGHIPALFRQLNILHTADAMCVIVAAYTETDSARFYSLYCSQQYRTHYFFLVFI